MMVSGMYIVAFRLPPEPFLYECPFPKGENARYLTAYQEKLIT